VDSIQSHPSGEGDLWILAVICDRGILPSMVSPFFLVVVMLWKQKVKVPVVVVVVMMMVVMRIANIFGMVFVVVVC